MAELKATPEDAASEFDGLMTLLATGESIDAYVNQELRLLVEAANNIKFAYIIRRLAQVNDENILQIGADAFTPDVQPNGS